MAKRKRSPKWSVFLVREPDRAVRHFEVSRTLVVALPTAAAVTVAGCLAGMSLSAEQRIQELEAQLERQSAEMEETVAVKNGNIVYLSSRLAELDREAADMRHRLEQIHELESKLRAFIREYGDGVFPEATDSRGEVITAFYGGLPSDAQSEKDAEAENEFAELLRLLDGLALTMDKIRERERQRQFEATSEPAVWPTVSRKLTSGFGYRKDPFTGHTAFHAGVDIDGKTGDPVFAAGSGIVKEAGFHSERGNYIVIAHRNGIESSYYHLQKIEVSKGDQVMRGDRIGRLGNTGRSTGSHLHFEITVGDQTVSPLRYLRLVKED
jgi:murein DD-endopeptidase MepM/ murein hydrolase activator NlpD